MRKKGRKGGGGFARGAWLKICIKYLLKLIRIGSNYAIASTIFSFYFYFPFSFFAVSYRKARFSSGFIRDLETICCVIDADTVKITAVE